MNNKVTLNEAVKFHGHLGPYLILGILAGEAALKKLGCKKYFGLSVKVWGANKKPKSCLIDGLQLSTGATYGKGNIKKADGSVMRIEFNSSQNHKRISLRLKKNLIRRLKNTKTHEESETLAKRLYGMEYVELFDLEGVS
jgi:formylmethanofuran dehydrogenase subunit E